MDVQDIKERVRAALPFEVVAQHDGLVLRRSGQGRWTCCCPFHEERSPSFVVGGRYADKGHCFGCGWSGDIFAFWQQRRDVDFKTALEHLAGLAGVPFAGLVYEKPLRRVPVARPSAERLGSEGERPALPSLRHLTAEECAQLAAVRGLNVDAVKAAAAARRIGYADWPLYRSAHDGRWLPRSSGAFPSWVITDGTRRVAEFRRLDGEKYVRADGTGIKAWSTAGKSWPVGATDIGARACVMLVEGGPDCLAAIDLLRQWRMANRVAVVCMLGAGNRIHEDALTLFEGKRVRIMMDADEPKDSEDSHKRKMPGLEAAGRWQAQLQAAGAVVETFCVGPIYEGLDVKRWQAGEIRAAEIAVRYAGLQLPDGALVKDLNDLARCAPEVREAEQIREAFTQWDF